MKPFFVYILKCSDNSYYVGHTDNIEARLSMHNQKLVCGYTSNRLPVKVVFVQDFGSRYEALAAERQIKGWTRKKKEALIAQNWNKLMILAKSNNRPNPSTSSGRTGESSVLAFTPESIEGSGRTVEDPSDSIVFAELVDKNRINESNL